MTEMKHELHLNARPEAVWQELTKQGRNDWYFLLDVDGTFTAGERVVWRAGGEVAEEAEVVAADPPHRLELRPRGRPLMAGAVAAVAIVGSAAMLTVGLVTAGAAAVVSQRAAGAADHVEPGRTRDARDGKADAEGESEDEKLASHFGTSVEGACFAQ